MARVVAGEVRLLIGACLLVTVFLVAASAPISLAVEFGQYPASTTVAVGMGLLFVVLISIVFVRMESWRVWSLLLAAGFVATALSRLYVVDTSSIACSSFFFSLQGFPFIWYGGPGFHILTTIPICPLPTFIPRPRMDWAAFFLDIFFYAGAFFSLLEIVRGIMQTWRRRREVGRPF